MKLWMWCLLSLVACDGKADKSDAVDTDPILTEDSEPPEDTDMAVETDPPIETDPPVEPTDVTIEAVDPLVSVQFGRAEDVLRFTITAGAWTAEDVTLSWSSDVDGALTPPAWDAESGTWWWSTAPLTAGSHELTLVASVPDGGTETLVLELGVCEWPAVEEFTAGIGGDWTAYDAAAWDAGGWLEITGNVTSSRGSIYKTTRRVNAGDFKMAFDIATGGGAYTGGDGYAINIVNVPDVAALEDYIGIAAWGGCLGYGITLDCEVGSTISAFHIEFDTWRNDGDNAYDPTYANHVGVMMDGDPSNHLLWADFPTLEDLNWHHVVVEVRSTRVQVSIDGQLLIDGTIPGLTFDGGYIGISGSTGLATNFHRFDNLRIEDHCLVPDAQP
jgi:hypothetical protein